MWWCIVIKVVAALIENNGKYLIAKRSTGDPNTLGKWEFPGWKVESGENEFQAIKREIAEEFDLQIEAQNFITNNIHTYPSNTIDLRLYSCQYIAGDFKLNNHSEYKWVTLDEMLSYDLAPADIPLVKYLKTNIKWQFQKEVILCIYLKEQ